ncbi:putative epidermal cell surface receptor [Cydia fagiglandana]|uniref:putative epidermal cell surface receptor n=1 Tax=Cydia fagiglandana TaxID=1458189 RepID=UPI002FEE5B7A
MAMCARAALLCALVLAGAHAYTVDCNREYTDCDSELSKLVGEEDDGIVAAPQTETTVEMVEHLTESPSPTSTKATAPPTRSTAPPTPEPETGRETERETETTKEDDTATIESPNLKPKGRLLNLNLDELKNFALTLHNSTKVTDLSDVTLDGEEEFDPSKLEVLKSIKDLPDKFYSNLQAPFHPALLADHSDEGKEEGETICVENGISYKVGHHVDRSCEETCECMPNGKFNCSPRCKHPYVRRGRTLNDPLCFESPVDECCSIIACATGNGDTKVTKLEVCKYGNDTHLTGDTWNVGCEQRCTCEKNSIIVCKPRCAPLPPSDKCINVQDPKDACCEVQICDVSQDVHEDQTDNVTNSTTTAEIPNLTEEPPTSTTMRPLVLTEPIGSIKVLQNNSVQVALMHSNSSDAPIHLLISNDGGTTFEDVELKYDNLILNLDGGKDYILKTKETGTKFNFTITSMDMVEKEPPEELVEVDEKMGCHENGKFYEVGEEFHIGCSELCECTGDETRECAALECPSHVGLELMSKGCVRWAPSPPPAPPNCCPRAARCLSDGTCHYNGVPIPNWTDVPISLTGCSQRCFCENGELDCQEVCSPLPPLPPQNMRCPPGHHPGAVNISIDDCCQQWGCVPHGNVLTRLVVFPLPRRTCAAPPDTTPEPSTSPSTTAASSGAAIPPPPQNMRCPPGHHPGAVNISIDDCCQQWGCVPHGQTPSSEVPSSTQTHIPKAPFLPTVPPDSSIHFPDEDVGQNHIIQQRPVNPLVNGLPPGLIPSGIPGITVPPNNENKKLTVINLVADSPTSVKMLFALPPVLVGLRGSVDLRYTDKADEDISHWYSQVFAPADEVLTTSRLEFRLTGLKPATVYKMRGKLYLHNLPVEPESEIYSIRTLDPLPTVAPVEVKRREIDSRMAVHELNDSVAQITWKRFTEADLPFIDAIQVRYRPVGNPIYSMTELLHHSRDSVFLQELRPGSRYEASLVLVPPPGATTELHDPAVLEFTTAPYIDPYNWSVQLEARSVGAEAAELTWRGVPAPAERWVRVYRAAHACGAGRREHDAFRLAVRDQAPAITLTGLEPDTRCRVWLELFLTNGKVKTSNVLEINTKSLDSPEPIDNAIEASSVGGAMAPRGDYYGALVVVGVVAALGALTSLLLLLVVVRRHRPRSVPITPVPTAPRESSLPPYDNPAYKLELQQETMDL